MNQTPVLAGHHQSDLISPLGNLYASLLAPVFIVVFTIGIPGYLQYTYLPSTSGANWKLAFMVATLPLYLMFPSKAISYLRTPFVLWSFAYVAFTFGYLFTYPDPVTGPIQTSFSQTLLAAIVSCFSIYLASARLIRRAILVAGIMLAMSIWLDFFAPDQFLLQPAESPTFVEGRAAGTLRNPNFAAMALTMMALVLASARHLKFSGMFIVLLLLTVLPTLSRAGIVAVVLVATALVLSDKTHRPYGLAVLFAGFIGFLSVSSLQTLIEQNMISDQAILNAGSRIELIASGDAFSVKTQARFDAAYRAWQAFLDSPVAGIGPAMTAIWGTRPHNQPLTMAAELGVIGLLFWMFLLVLIVRGNRFTPGALRWFAAALILVFSMLSHTMLERVSPIIFLYMFCSVSQGRNRNGRLGQPANHRLGKPRYQRRQLARVPPR